MLPLLLSFFGFLFLVLDVIAVVHILLVKKRPASALAWVWFVMLVPYIGVIAYYLLGADRMKRRKLRRMRKAREEGPEKKKRTKSLENDPSLPVFQALATINEIPVSSASAVKFLEGGKTFYEALLKRIEAAEHHIHIEFFIWQKDHWGERYIQALTAAAQRGVEVRVLLDQIGCLGYKLHQNMAPLIAAGGKVSWFHTTTWFQQLRMVNLRNHRKIQIIDGKYAFVGGMNLGKEYASEAEWPSYWRDLQIEVQGEIVVQLQETFSTDWYFATNERWQGEVYFRDNPPAGKYLCQIIAGGPDLPRDPLTKSIVHLLNSAKERAWISAGYFVPDSVLISALQVAASRGVDVRLVISGVTDHKYLLEIGRSIYEDLLQFGVRIFEYQKGMNHAKTFLLDEEWCSIGSANFDNRSMRLNFELNLFLHSPGTAKELEAMLVEDFENSREITLIDLAARTWKGRFKEALLRPLAPML